MTRKEKIALLIDELGDIRCNNFDADTDEDKTLKEAVRVIKALEQKPKWIPCSERLPKKIKDVIVTDIETSDTYQSQYIGNGYWACDNGNFRNRIVAWMPLPEPYKSESEEV